MKFKEFFVLEQKQYLGQKVGDILSATQELKDDSKNMGSRDLSRFSEKIVNQIRKILHSYWSKENQKYLKDLQKIGVAIMKAVKEKGDLQQTISGASSSLEELISKIGTPINKIASPDSDDINIDNKGVDNPVQNTKDQYKPPQQKKDIDNQTNISSPINKDPQLSDSPPLAGNSGQQLGAV